MKNSTFDFTNFKSQKSCPRERTASRSKSREKGYKGDERIEVTPAKDIDSEIAEIQRQSKRIKKSYYIPVSLPDRMKEQKGSRSNSRTKTVSISKIHFAKNSSQNKKIKNGPKNSDREVEKLKVLILYLQQ